MDPHVRCNQELWDAWADVNYRSAFYDVEGFKAALPPLDDESLAVLGDVAGKSVLHLQCHFGMDTLRIARLGATVTGVDFSSKAIGLARRLAAETGIAARFVESDVYALPDVLDETFDVIFTSYGVLGWLPDLTRWARVVARHLKPGGRFGIVEGHPTMWIFDNEHPTELRVRYPYFGGGEPLVLTSTGNYADPTADVTTTEHSWPHSLGEIVTALLAAGLRLDSLREYDHAVWRAFPFMTETSASPRRFEQPPGPLRIPILFAITATKPA